MSAGSFSRAKYELDGGTIVPIRVQPETISLTDGTNANDEPAGSVTLDVTAYARKGNRQYGIGARCITIAWSAAPPTGYEDELLQIPVLTPATFAAYAVGDTVTYLATAAEIVSKKNEVLT